jgi:ABC-type uncharacterized transport system substrate-binding protein
MARCLAALAACVAASHGAEILVVLSDDKAPYHQAEDGLIKALAGAGHHAVAQRLDAELNDDRLAPFAALVGIGSKAAAWLHGRPVGGRPLVFCMVSDPGAAGLAKPPPMSGVSTEVAVVAQLALIAEALPAARTLGVLFRSDQEASRALVAEVRGALTAGWKLEAVPVDRHPSMASAIDALFDEPIDLVWTAPDSGIYTEATVRSLLLTALRRRVPVFGFSSSFVRSGALVGIGIDPAAQGAQAAGIVTRLLAGGAADAAIAPPDYEVEVNLVVAQKLGIELPPALIRRATQVYQPGR